MNQVDAIKEIDLLNSPVNPLDLSALVACSQKPLRFLSNVPCLEESIYSAEIIFASYGHLAYEAMAMGKPVCLVGQKDFQARYASELARRGLCVSAGLILDEGVPSLVNSVEETIKRQNSLVKINNN